MSDKALPEQLSDAEIISVSSGDDAPGESSNRVPTSGRVPRIRSKAVTPKAKLSIRQLVLAMHAKTRPEGSEMLMPVELSWHVRKGNVLMRRLRRFIASKRKFIEFDPMTPLQEAIAQQLAEDMDCQTRFYNISNFSQYMVVYRPGIDPDTVEGKARPACPLKISIVGDEKPKQGFMHFEKGKLIWHKPTPWDQPMEQKEPSNSAQDSQSLDKKILLEFNKDYQPIQKQQQMNLDKENKEE